MVNYTIDALNLHIEDSFKVSKRDFAANLIWVKQDKGGNEDSLVWLRSMNSLRREWATHNALYALGILRSHTKDVDLNYPQKWYMRLAYSIVGRLMMPFIR